MKRPIQLSIPNPCAENWEHFTASRGGRFCSSCSKVVVDFTQMTDEEIIRFIEKSGSHACGRFRPNQLRIYAPLYAPKINPGFTFLKAGLLSALLLLIIKPSSAQNIMGKTKTEEVDQKKNTNQPTESREKEHTIKGVVLSSEDGSPLPAVVVTLKGSELGIITNTEGRFEFPKKLKEGEVLLFSFIGLKTEEYSVPRHLDGPCEIKMAMNFDLMGELAVNEIYRPENSGFQKWWTKIKNLF